MVSISGRPTSSIPKHGENKNISNIKVQRRIYTCPIMN